uniref:Uncharacterized protein n=1 Tax=candidate division CPR3 bacterium TaxID=2268181 RepID=A0A7C4M502_UNCC3
MSSEILNQGDLDALFAQLENESSVDKKPAQKEDKRKTQGSKKNLFSNNSESSNECSYYNPYEPQKVERESSSIAKGIYKCHVCGKHFSAKIGSFVMESHDDFSGNVCQGSGKKIIHHITSSQKADEFLVPFLNNFKPLWVYLKQKGVV